MFEHYFVAICEFKLLGYSPETFKLGQNRRFFALQMKYGSTHADIG